MHKAVTSVRLKWVEWKIPKTERLDQRDPGTLYYRVRNTHKRPLLGAVSGKVPWSEQDGPGKSCRRTRNQAFIGTAAPHVFPAAENPLSG